MVGRSSGERRGAAVNIYTGAIPDLKPEMAMFIYLVAATTAGVALLAAAVTAVVPPLVEATVSACVARACMAVVAAVRAAASVALMPPDGLLAMFVLMVVRSPAMSVRAVLKAARNV